MWSRPARVAANGPSHSESVVSVTLVSDEFQDQAVRAPKQTPTGTAAGALGVSQSRLAAVSTPLNRPAVAAVGAVLAAAVLDEPPTGCWAGARARHAVDIATAAGNVAVPNSVMVLVPTRVIQ